MSTRVFVAIFLFTLASESSACLHSSKARARFMHANPCPATGKTRGACKGYIVDHITPLCAGGVDAPSNMQWQTVADARAKDKIERQQCKGTYMQGDKESR